MPAVPFLLSYQFPFPSRAAQTRLSRQSYRSLKPEYLWCNPGGLRQLHSCGLHGEGALQRHCPATRFRDTLLLTRGNLSRGEEH